MILQHSVQLTPAEVAEAFLELSDDDEAQVFIEIARLTKDWPHRGAIQWQAVGRHLRDCACSSDAARDVVTGIAEGNVGKACHILAASEGGPRYDAAQTEEQRRSIENGIWLCSTCSVLIDSDPDRFPPDVLRAWRVLAEHDARERIGKPVPATVAGPTRPSVALSVGHKRTLTTQSLHRYELDVRLRNVGTKRIDDWYIELEFPKRLIYEGGGTIGTRVVRTSDDRLWLFRTTIGNATSGAGRRPLAVGDEYPWGLAYRVDREIFYENATAENPVFDETATARAFVDGELVAEEKRRVGDLHEF